jgi:phosphoribosylcarboxyaminoimidazole (NCAIR) mutase
VGVVMGSDSDLPAVGPAAEALDEVAEGFLGVT